MLNGGFVTIQRKITKWRWYKKPATKCIFLHLLFTANYEPKEFENITIKRGQRVGSYETLSGETGHSIKEVRTAIKNLEKTGEVARQKYSHFTVFSVVNYDFYQLQGQGIRQSKGKAGAGYGQSKGNNGNKYNKDIRKINKYNAAPAAENDSPPEPKWDFPKEVDF